MSNHSNVQVGEVIEQYRDNNGVLHKTGVDDVGFYVVIKLRDDIEKAKEISRGIRKGTLRSFSIGGQAISKKQKNSEEFGEYNEIEKLELHEVTICEKGINPEARFDILKSEEEKKMSEKLEKALEELNDLMKQVNSLEKEEEMEKGDEYMDTDPDLNLGEEEDMDTEEKALDEDSTRDYEAGEEVVSGGKPTATPAPLKVSKGLEGTDFTTLDLSVENVEKAYEAFKSEKMEKLAYDQLDKEFSARFENEIAVKKSAAEKAEYDARHEVAALKEEFAELRKSLSAESEEIRKTQEVPMEIPEGLPTNIEEAHDMSWNDIHNVVRNYE